MAYVISCDIGTTGIKTCLYSIDGSIKLITSASASYAIEILPDGGAEQNPDEWWSAMCQTVRKVMDDQKDIEISGITFCSQMQSLVLVDEDGNALRNSMSYMDQRAKKEMKKGMGLPPHIAGMNILRLLKSLHITGAVAASVKDPVWKYKWVESNEKKIFSQARWWLDVKEYLVMRCTGRAVMSEDSAYATLLLDTRRGRREWSQSMCRMLGVDMNKLPPIVKSTDIVGPLTKKAALELGLPEGAAVFAGGGDASLIAVGAGCTRTGDTHIYNGTSGWVSTVVDKRCVDITAMIAAIVGAVPERYNYFAEMETAGKCLEWVRDHLALDEIGIYLKTQHVAEGDDAICISLYDYLTETVLKAPPGSGGVIFTPWMHGNRCPFEDPTALSIFFGIKLETGKTELIRAVLEGVCYHQRWMLECQDRKVETSKTLRFCGGGALSPVTAQLLADITGRTIEVTAKPQNAGAAGAAAVAGIGLGLIGSMDDVRSFIPVDRTYQPNLDNKKIYDKYYEVFKKLYKANRKNYKALERAGRSI